MFGFIPPMNCKDQFYNKYSFFFLSMLKEVAKFYEWITHFYKE